MADSHQTEQVVVDVGKWEWSELFLKEDWWAIWLGFFILLAGALIYFPQSSAMQEKLQQAEAKHLQAAQRTDKFKTIAWYHLYDERKKVKAKSTPVGNWLSTFSKKTHSWKSNPLDAFMMSSDAAENKRLQAMAKYDKAKLALENALIIALAAELKAEEAGFNNVNLNEDARVAIGDWRNAYLDASNAKKKTKAKPYNQIGWLLLLGTSFAVFFGIGMKAMGNSFKEFVIGFSFIFLIAVLAYLASSQTTMKQYGVGYAAWAISLACLSPTPLELPNGQCQRYRQNTTLKQVLSCLAPKYSSKR